jgi:hypothetical protein
MSILHIESFENRGDEGLLAKTDRGAGAGAVFLAVDFDAEELACRAEIGDLVFFREPGLDFDRSVGSVFLWANSLSVRIEVNVIDDRADISLELTNTRVSRRAALMPQSRTNVTEPHLM